MKRIALFLTVLMALALLASASFAVEETSWGDVKQTLGQDELRPVAKPAKFGMASDIFYPNQLGRLLVEENMNGNDPTDDLKVTFDVPQNSVSEPVEITMAVTGETVEDLVITFYPAGLVFNLPAQLEIRLGSDRFTSVPETFTVYHKYSDGTIEEAVVNVSTQGGENFLLIQVAVPGFSRYSMGGGA